MWRRRRWPWLARVAAGIRGLGAGLSGLLCAQARPQSTPSDTSSEPAASPNANETSKPEPPEAIPVDAAATEPGAAGTEPAHKSRLIGEIIVTAQKREENGMDVPLSVQAFGEELLDARGIRDQEGLQMVTPGLSVNSTITYATLFLRGIGTNAFLTGDPSVANYIDGIYFPIASGMIQEFGAVERVEVLEDPQGTLFGRNAVGGAIVTTTKNPDLSEFEGSVPLSAGNFEDGQLRV